MNGEALWAAVAFAVIAATLSAVEKIRHRRSLQGASSTYDYTFVFQLLCAAAAAPLLLASIPSFPEIALVSVGFIFLSALCWVGFSLATFKSDSMVPASIKAGVSRLRIIWSLILGVAVLNESVSGIQVAGALLIAVAPLLLVRGLASTPWRGPVLEVFATVLLAGALLFDTIAMETVPAGVVTFASFANAAVMILLFRRFRSARPEPGPVAATRPSLQLPTGIPTITLTAVVSVGCYFALMQALSIGDFSVVMPVYMLSPVILLVLAYWTLKEKENPALKAATIVVSSIGGVLTVLG